jgi:EAL domain-containing protein (putative c-di-GMP-specific phosphodiesterase class I)
VKIEPRPIVFQLREEVAAQHIKEAVALHKALPSEGSRFALEGFGMGRDTSSCSTT